MFNLCAIDCARSVYIKNLEFLTRTVETFRKVCARNLLSRQDTHPSPFQGWEKNIFSLEYCGQRPRCASMALILLCVLLGTWISRVSSINVFISQEFGVDNSSCYHPNGTSPCRSISYALGILNDVTFENETTFIFSIRDKQHNLSSQVFFSQPREDRNIFMTSADNSTATIIRCGSEHARIDIGFAQAGDTVSTYNIHVSNIEFQQFCASSAAVVMIWNSDNVSFTSCVFRDNRRSGINAFDSGVTVEGCLFVNNTASARYTRFKPGLSSVAGGAGFVFVNLNGLNVVVRNTTFAENSAAINDSENYIAPPVISVISELNYVGGGLVIAFLNTSKSNRALVEGSVFERNKATFGGGLFHCSCHFTKGNTMNVRGCSFTGNRAAQAGGGLSTSLRDYSIAKTLVEDSVIRDNWSRRGGGLNFFVMDFYSMRMLPSVIKFNNVTLDGNDGRASAAVRLDSALPVSSPIYVTPEFINCTIMNHGANYLTYTAPFTSQRVDAKFIGRNVFTENHGAGAVEYQEGVIHVDGILEFIKNSGSHGGAVLLRASQVKLYPASELRFEGNFASSLGGAVMVQNQAMYEFIHMYNPDCFVVYSEEKTEPSKWKVRP